MGANVVRDFPAGITDITGGRSGAYEQMLGQARDVAILETIDQAQRVEANAIVGLDRTARSFAMG